MVTISNIYLNMPSIYLFLFICIYLFVQKTTIVTTVTKVPVHELDKKANKPALTIARS